MQLVIERAPALAALSRAAAVVERSSATPILSNVALFASAGMLTLRAGDLAMEVSEQIPAEIKIEGSITIPADKFRDIVRNSDTGAQVALSLSDADPRVLVKSGRSQFKVPALPADDFPVFGIDGLGEPFALPAKTLATMLASVKWMAKGSSEHDVMNGVFLVTVEGELRVVGCSAAGVALARMPAPEGARLSALLPMKLVNQLVSWLADAEGDALISVEDWQPGDRKNWDTQKKINIEYQGGRLTALLLDAPGFVNYPMFLIDTHDFEAITDQDALTTALRRVLIMQEDRSSAVALTFSTGGLSVRARTNQAGEGAEELSAEFEGDETSILLAPRLLSEALGVLRGDQVKVAFGATGSKAQGATLVLIEAPSDPSIKIILNQPRA